MTKMKILHVLVTLDKGGAENHVAQLAVLQHRLGHSVTLAYLKGKGQLRNQMEDAGISVVDLNMRFYGDPRALMNLMRLYTRLSPEVAHAHLPGAEIYLAVLRRLTSHDVRRAFIASRHNDAPFGQTLLHTWLESWVTKQFDKVICISGAVRTLFAERRKTLEASRATRVYYGIDSAPFAAISSAQRRQRRIEWGAQEHTIIYLCIARLVPQKAIDVLLKAYASMLGRTANRVDSLLLIVGHGHLLSEMKALSNSLGISDRVHWAGFQENIPEILMAADVLVLTSLYEGLGLVLLEAGAAGKPSIASNVSAIPEIVIDGETGILVAPSSISGFSDAFLAIRDAALRDRLGSQSRKRVEAMFTPEACLHGVMNVYSQALS